MSWNNLPESVFCLKAVYAIMFSYIALKGVYVSVLRIFAPLNAILYPLFADLYMRIHSLMF